MPGYMIHLAVGTVYSKNNKIEDLKSFNKGIIDPDLLGGDKQKTHYGLDSAHPGLNKYINSNGMQDSYQEGYFLHLLTDYLFYNKFLTTFSTDIYDDYDRLNLKIKEKYKIKIPEEVQDVVKFKEGRLTVLEEEKLYKFIESVGKINVRDIISKRDIDYEREIQQLNLEI